ncbi:mechanosensitive ion channel family protein [Acidobacteria bacterium AB60]|nr:mechanosensitive ion channel family protein [Acidobacteria bacterium AB60]
MENPPLSTRTKAEEPRSSRFAWFTVAGLAVLLILCLVFAWTTQDAMQHLPTGVRGRNGRTASRITLVDQTPWQTAQALAALAVTAEENEFAREAERLADHEVDQAFAAALREATLRAQHRSLTGDALALSQRITQLEQVVAQDQATVQQLSRNAPKDADQPDPGSDLEIAKAQLQLDSDELADANEDLDRATGDERSQIQSELTTREAAMKKFDSGQGSEGQLAVISVSRYGTLAGRIAAWKRQRARLVLIQQAQQQALADAQAFTQKHNALEAQANANTPAPGNGSDRNTRLASLRDRTTERQLLSIYDDRINTEQRLATVYQKWAAQVELQHRIVLHLLLQSVAWILLILIGMVLGDVVISKLIKYPVLDRRQRHTLRTVLVLAVQVLGALLILFIIFGTPHQTSTILGLATAALTIALQDFVIAFFGWFVLMGSKGMRVGDTVEINGVGGEVTEIGLMSTTLLETGPLATRGYPTGRRITFMNSFAIRGQYFNFSTTGQWMLDQFEVTIPASDETHVLVEQILKAVEEETSGSVQLAEQEWKRAIRGDRLREMRASPSVNLRPSGPSNFSVEVRYVTRATEREETRNRLYRRVIDVLRSSNVATPAGDSASAPRA